jgi:hypothetical protein
MEHFDHAIKSGQHAAGNMLGGRKAYTTMPFFWSDLGSVGYEAIGITDAKLPTVGVWEKPEGDAPANPEFKKGIVYYLQDNRVVGAIFFGLYGKTGQAARVIGNRLPYQDDYSFKNLISLDEEHHDEPTLAD